MDKEKLIEKIKRKVIAGVKFLAEEKTIVGKEQIKSILPHRGRMLLLDRVTITTEKIIGEFSITSEVCSGHEIGGWSMFRGIDYAEMTAQLLGIWLTKEAAQYPDLNLSGKLAPLRKASFKCISPAFPGDLLRVEMPVTERKEEEGEDGNPRIETVGTEDRPARLKQQVIGLNATVWVGDRKKAVIYFIELGIVGAKSLVK